MIDANDLAERLETSAEDDVRAIAKDMRTMGVAASESDLNRWADLQDEGATALRTLARQRDKAVELLKELVRLGTHGTGYVHVDWLEAHDEAKEFLAAVKERIL